VVEENQKLREKLRMLHEVSSQKSSSAQMHQMSSEAEKVAQNFENYKINSNQEIKKLRTLK
jgi:DNA-binding transcriptional regulator YiaG